MTTSTVITMEYVPGIKINDIEKIEAAGIDRKLLAKYSAESYLTQLCRHGFFRKFFTGLYIHIFHSIVHAYTYILYKIGLGLGVYFISIL